MEFPHLGAHCNESSCNKLDFLPIKCDGCSKIFCAAHYRCGQHDCPTPTQRDHQVPLCPLCDEPVPTAPGVQPDITVSQHIDQECKLDTKKIFTNQCSFKNCQRRELVPVNCSECRANFCLRHRHTADHECKGRSSALEQQRTSAANAAQMRRIQKPPTTLFNLNLKPNIASAKAAAATKRLSDTTAHIRQLQGNVSDDEALARAMAISIMELDESNDRNRRNAEEPVAPANTLSNKLTDEEDKNSQSKEKCNLL